MLVEKNISEAMKAYDKGKKVLVLMTMCDGSISCDRLENLFPEDTHFLVDVPVVQNSEFAAAAHNMMHGGTTETTKEESETPP